MSNSQVISDKARRSSKLWELFKYLVTNRGKPVPVENIIDSLWPDHDYCDQNAALHTLNHRMRKLFYEEFESGNEPFNLDVSQGCYRMVFNDKCWIDTDEFASYTRRAVDENSLSPEVAIDIFRKAINLYQGEYLPEYTAKKWVLPAKRHYRNLYLQNLLGKIKVYMAIGQYEAVSALCEKSFQVEQFMEVESLHIYFMEALLRSGNAQKALCHYDFLTSSLYQEYGTKPSAEMRDLYRRMKPAVDGTGLNLRAIIEKMGERDHFNGAFVCDIDFFRFLYNLEVRRSDRNDSTRVLALLSLSRDDDLSSAKSVNMTDAMEQLEKILLDDLRKGDVITRCSESQFLALLSDVDKAGAGKVLQRLKRDFIKANKSQGFKLEINMKQNVQKDFEKMAQKEPGSKCSISEEL